MAKLNFKNGFGSVILRVKIMDTASTTGAGKTGLTSASSGLVISTIADNEATATAYSGSNLETITTLGTFAAPTSGKARFKEVDATNHPGLYELQIADARWAVSNARSAIVTVSGVTGAAQVDAEIQLEPVPANVRQLLDTAWLTPATPGTPDVRLGNLSHGGVAAVLTLERMIVASTTTNEPAIKASGNGLGSGIISTGGASGNGLHLAGGSGSGHGLLAVAQTDGHGIKGVGGLTSGDGFNVLAQAGNGNGATFAKNGTGKDIAGTLERCTLVDTATVAGSVTAGVTLAASAVQAIWDAATSALTTAGSIGKRIADYLTGDSFARLGAPAGASTAADIAAVKAETATLAARLSAARAGYLDNLNVGGPVSSQADVLAINQSASRRIILTTVLQYERPESGSTVYTVEARLYDGDGSDVNADSTPTLTATGSISGSLAGNLSAASNPATGVYLWTYTVTSAATSEQIRFVISATIAGSTFTLPLHTQVVDLVGATWTTTDASHLTSIFNKLPANNIADETLVLAAVAAVQADTDDIQTTIGLAGAGLTAIPKTGFKLASDGFDSVIIEGSISAGAGLTNDTGTQLTSINARQALAIIAAANGAVLAGADVLEVTIKPAGKPAGNNRIDAIVTADGNRTSVALKVPD